MNDSLLLTDRGTVVSFGRVKIPMMPSLGFNYEIPLLSFVVIERDAAVGYIASCIHLQIDGYGGTPDEAINDMIDSIWQFLGENFKNEEYKNEAWDNIRELFMSNPASDILWDKYHVLQIRLAQKGIATDPYTELYNKIEALKKKVSELEATVKEKNLIISKITNDMVVEYGLAAA